MKREDLEFRTPQHPSLGTNRWGGASPLLARNIPKETLDQRYLRLESVRTHDVFPVFEDDFNCVTDPLLEKREHVTRLRRIITIRALLPKFVFRRNGKKAELRLGSKKKTWLPRLDAQYRWPQGWC